MDLPSPHKGYQNHSESSSKSLSFTVIYQRIPPCPALRAFVKEYMLFHLAYDKKQPTLAVVLPPLPEHGLEFLPKGLATSVNQLTGGVRKESPNVLFGQPVSRVNYIVPAEDYLVIRVVFQPGGLFRLLGGVPLTEFTDKLSDAASVLNRQVQVINERLLEAGSYPTMIAIVEGYLLTKTRLVKMDVHAADKIGALLLDNPTRFSLDWLAHQANLSSRQLNRKFTERMGVGPKLFARISRFHQAFLWKEAHPQADWLSVAINFGYSDFQHLFKDFKEFAGVTPNALLKECAFSPEKFLVLEK